jgi:selenocysteine lyase/cysteine desulfurase
MTTYPIEQIRADYRALQEVCYLNTGTVGIMSETVLASHLANIARYERYGHAGEEAARAGYERARQALAELINAAPAEIALTRNATDGINYVLHGLDLPANSAILTTNQEHPAVLHPLALKTRSSPVSIDMIDIDGSDDDLLAQLNRKLAQENVSLAIISHVSCETGRRLPSTEICRICKEHDVLTLVDGAQSVGQFQVDVDEIDCDYMTGNGHKWLCGPKGTGFLYVRQDQIPTLTPPYAGDGAVDPRFDRTKFSANSIADDWEFRADAQRFEFGTRNWHLYEALADSIDQLAGIGWEHIQRHVEQASDNLKAGLAERTTLTVHTPDRWVDSCGLVTFSAPGLDGVTLSNRLWQDHKVIQRRVQIPSGVRISCAHFTDQNDIDHFFSALDSAVKQ